MTQRACILVALLLPTAFSFAREPADDAQVAFEAWFLGKTQSEVVEFLGEPTRTKKRHGATILIFSRDPAGVAMFPSATPNPYAFLEEGEPQSGGVEVWIDAFLNPPTAKRFTGQDHFYQLAEQPSPFRRIKLRLDAENHVDSVQVDWRKRPKRQG